MSNTDIGDFAVFNKKIAALLVKVLFFGHRVLYNKIVR